ncbi:hypothetical protein [Phyllobacterium sp. SB3]|uniref:hypothetical protein n=1 Tax=Phyllobacterium sp. SB3 TaxID=3156073 RepID=UPI0032AF0A3F
MWRLLKQLFGGKTSPSSPEDDGGEIVRFDDNGFHRSSKMARNMGWRQDWSWEEVTAFGFSFSPAMFPDPWFGDYMEDEWFVTVLNENGPENIFFDAAWLNIDRLPPALVRNMPGLDMARLREGLAAAAGGYHNYEGEGRWQGWSKPAPKPARRPRAKVKTVPAAKPKIKKQAK